MSSLQPDNYDDLLESRDPQNGRCLQENFSSEIKKKEFITLLRVSYCWHLNVL